jgi:hypothetical protein
VREGEGVVRGCGERGGGCGEGGGGRGKGKYFEGSSGFVNTKTREKDRLILFASLKLP